MTRRLFVSLCGLVFAVNFARVAFAPLVPEFQTDLGLSAGAVGSVTTLVWLGTAAPRLPVGYVLTRVPRRHVVIATGVALTLAAALTATADSLLTLQIGAFAVGLSTGGYFVAAIPLIGALYPSTVGRAVGIHGTASQIAAVVAPTAVLAVVARTADWRMVFVLLAVGAMVVTATVVIVLVRRDKPPDVREPGQPRAGEMADDGAEASDEPDRSFRAALDDWKTIVSGVVLVAGVGFAWQGVFNFYVSYLLGRGLPGPTANGLLTAAFAAGVPAFWFGGRLADRLPSVPYLLGIHVAFTLLLISLTLVDGVIPLTAVSIGLGLVLHSLFPAVDTYMLSTLTKPTRASAYAVFSGVALFVEAMGSGVVGFLTDTGLGFTIVFRAFGTGLALLTIVLILAFRGGVFPNPPSED